MEWREVFEILAFLGTLRGIAHDAHDFFLRFPRGLPGFGRL